MSLKKHFMHAYGHQRKEPVYTRCAAEVGVTIQHQCRKPNGHGPDGAFCPAHIPKRLVVADPLAITRKRNIGSMQAAIDTLNAIAEGKPNPQGAARDCLRYYQQLEWWPK